MKAKDVMVIAGAALAVWALFKFTAGAPAPAPEYWATQGNTGYPAEARTGGQVWV